MAKRNAHSFKKFQKEMNRKKKAKEKRERRQGKKNDTVEVEELPQDIPKPIK